MTTARSRERLRQEREAFEQKRAHCARWFVLRLCMGYAGMTLLFLIAVVSGYVILTPDHRSSEVVTAATGSLLVDMLGLVATIFRLVLGDGSIASLTPTTGVSKE